MNSNIRKFTYITLTILTICFIFYNSTRNGTDSSSASNSVTSFLNNILLTLHINININSYFVRKLAHFFEFFLLGMFITFTFESFTGNEIKYLGYILFLSLLVPVLDETIQLFSVGRSSKVLDVLIDFSGAITGITYVFIFLHLKRKFKCNFKKDLL